ncbi:MAG TPA: glycosyltransferase family 2 protein [Firmicutes bacterium]|nr:glycosyltransferase family 2 protein [Candidatus Fermentithermobacillaceae bacterium]
MSLSTDIPYLMSVIVPAYNAEEHVGSCLESLCRQSLRNFEVIVVNDGSKDRTAAVAEAVLSQSGLPYHVLSQSNQGVSVARNSGLKVAKGKYVMFLDSDDYLHENCLAELTHRAVTTQASVVFCGYDYVSHDGELLRPYTERHVYLQQDTVSGPEALIEVFTERISVWTGSVMYLKDHLTRYDIRFIAGRTMAQDIEFEFKALFYAGRVSCVNQSLSFYVQMPGSATRTGDFLKRLQGMDVLFALLDHFAGHVQSQEQRQARVGLGEQHSSEYDMEKRVIECLQTYMIPVSLAGVFGSLAADGYPWRDYIRLVNNRANYMEALNMFSPVFDANFAARRRFQVRLLRSSPSVYFVLSRIRGRLR